MPAVIAAPVSDFPGVRAFAVVKRAGKSLGDGVRGRIARSRAAPVTHASNVGPVVATGVMEGSVAAPGADAGADATARLPKTGTPLNVRIDDVWYDLSGWRSKHPAGSHWIDMFDGRDATEIMYAFHSDFARRMVPRLPKSKAPPPPGSIPDVTPLTRSFREFRQRLVDEGWFERDWRAEAAHLLAWASTIGLALLMLHSDARAAQQLAFAPLAMSFITSGWLAHDYIHGRGPFCEALRYYGTVAAGFSPTMWSDKHNRHHALTNEMGQDEDLSGGPILWVWAPDPAADRPWRKYQHIYYVAAFSLLHVVWRIDSMVVAWKRSLKVEQAALVGHYALFLGLFPLATFVQAVFFAGMARHAPARSHLGPTPIMAFIVTSSHQSEELYAEHEHDWVKVQFSTTRDAQPSNPFTTWLWGGMQHQLEHHLFPTMPRYKYPKLIPEIRAFAAKHGLEYRTESDWDILLRTWRNYAKVAGMPAVAGAPMTRKGTTI